MSESEFTEFENRQNQFAVAFSQAEECWCFTKLSSFMTILTKFSKLRKYSTQITSRDQKRVRALTEKRARVFCLWAEAFFCLNLLVTFASRQK
ncbi:MAG: hypothetical protein AAGC65_02385 [Mucilaginibacter sp.]|uniref:hypothetical protein n=1 Tax=Mucilaginibacter sp. TaxID=1882438 RepID=UPI0031AABB55